MAVAHAAAQTAAPGRVRMNADVRLAHQDKLFAVSFCPVVPYAVAVAGGKGKVEIWNIANLAAVRRRFDDRILEDVPAPVRVLSRVCVLRCQSRSVA